MVQGPSRRAVFISGGVFATGLGGLAAAAQERDAEGPDHERSIEWEGLGDEHAEQNCPDERGYWQWVLTPGGPTPIETDAELTVTFDDDTEVTVEGYRSGRGDGAVHFDVYKDGGGTVVGATARFDGGGNNPTLTIGEGECATGDGNGEDPTLEVSTGDATAIDDSATLTGELTAMTGFDEASVYFEWREADEPAWTSTDPETVTDPAAFDVDLEGLAPGTTYEFRAVAEADAERTTGDVRTFATTTPAVPSVTTLAATGVEESTATLNGTLASMGDFAEVEVSFEWRASGAETWSTTDGDTLDAVGGFDADLDGLRTDTAYEFRAVGEAGEHVVTGSIETFVTGKTLPSVETGEATDVVASSATLTGELTDLGDFDGVAVFFEWREADVTWSSTDEEFREDPGTIEIRVDGLDPDTAYEYRIVGEVSDEIRVEGEVRPFSTPEDGEDEKDGEDGEDEKDEEDSKDDKKDKPDLDKIALEAVCRDDDTSTVEYAVANGTDHDLKFEWQLASEAAGGKVTAGAGSTESFVVEVEDPSTTLVLYFDGEALAEADGEAVPACETA